MLRKYYPLWRFASDFVCFIHVSIYCVGVIDASAGVEAQTKTVWMQANKFNISRLIFLNKMDKRGADIKQCLESIKSELGVAPLLTQLNIGLEQDFTGVLLLSVFITLFIIF